MNHSQKAIEIRELRPDLGFISFTTEGKNYSLEVKDRELLQYLGMEPAEQRYYANYDWYGIREMEVQVEPDASNVQGFVAENQSRWELEIE